MPRRLEPSSRHAVCVGVSTRRARHAGRRLLRHERRRSVSLVRAGQRSESPRMDHGRERACAALPRRNRDARDDQEAHDGAVELRALRVARAPRRSLFLFAQRRSAEPERAVRVGQRTRTLLHVSDSVKGQPRVLLDPNTLSKDATIALAEIVPSPDGKVLAYSLSDGGSDWRTWHFRDVGSGADLPDVLRFMKFALVSWTADSRIV